MKKASKKREIRPPRGSQLKTSVDKSSEGRRKASAVSTSPPQGEVLGGKATPMAASSKVSPSYGFDDSPPDAASEKDLVSCRALLRQWLPTFKPNRCFSGHERNGGQFRGCCSRTVFLFV